MNKINKLERVSFIILILTIILTPLVFVPSVYTSLDAIKTITITVGTLLSGFIYFIFSLKNKSLHIPRHPLFVVSCGIVFSLIISTILSSNSLKSLFGQGFEIGTTSTLITLFLVSLLTVYLTNNNKKRILYVFGAIFTSFTLIAIFQILRLIGGPDFMTLNILKLSTSTILGKWNDIALFSGIIFIISYIALRFTILKKSLKILLIIPTIISGLFLILINSTLIWSAVLIILVLLSFFEYTNTKVDRKGIKAFLSRLPVITIILIFISIVFIWKGDSIIKPLTDKMNIVKTEVVLPWQLTLDITADTIKESPIFGAGPNRFGSEYIKFKPLVVNPTVFWNTEFDNGFGLIPTFIVTQGLLGLVLWATLFVVLISTGLKAIKINYTDNQSRFFVVSTFFSTLFLFIISIVYTPSHSILFLGFILGGLFLSSIINEGNADFIKIEQINNSFLTKFVPVMIVIIIAIHVIWFAVFIKKTIARAYFQAGIASLNTADNQGLVSGESLFKKALSIDKVDTFYQALSEVNILKVTSLIQQIKTQSINKNSPVDPEVGKQIGAMIDEAVQYTKEAIKIDPTNYYNYIAQARIFELALSLQVQYAYENTKLAYENALKVNPYSPSIYLNLARINVLQNKLDDAQKNIGTALQLKQNYVDAIFLLSQIQVSQGQIKEAITSAEVASQINPNNPQIFFQLGLLHYNNKNYQEAIDTLNKAIKLDHNYANAQYFLGLSFARMNKFQDAILQFESLSISNPDNQEVSLILSNLKDGKSPFTDAKPPIDNKPEQRKSLPIKSK